MSLVVGMPIAQILLACQLFAGLGFLSYWWLGAAFVNPAVSKRVTRWAPYLIGCYILAMAAVIFPHGRRVEVSTL
jgi:hypothetical protein